MTMRTVAFDVETIPGRARIWRTGQQYVGLDQVVQPTRMACFAARFNDRKKTEFYSEWEHGHQEMVVQAQRILDEADAVLHFNGVSFDEGWMKAEIIMAGLERPSPFASIDLYRQTKDVQLVSHKLQHVSTHLARLEGKVPVGGWDFWWKVEEGDEAARRLFKKYNIRDVDVLWEVYDVLLPWLKVPNANLFQGEDGCPRCGKANTGIRRGFRHTTTGTYTRFQCSPARGGCGGYWVNKHRVASTENVAV